jgi:hypothetical protein
MGEYVAYYNPTGHVMHFTRNRDEAYITCDHHWAAHIVRIAREVYKRKYMDFGIVLD